VLWIPTARGDSLASSSPTFRFLTALSIFAAIFCSGAEAQVYEKVFSFADARAADLAASLNKGSLPFAGLIQSTDGNLYGTTSQGGGSDLGTVFKISPNGVLTTLVQFSYAGTKGSQPEADLIEGSDGNFYGTTLQGGANDLGTVFKMTPT